MSPLLARPVRPGRDLRALGRFLYDYTPTRLGPLILAAGTIAGGVRLGWSGQLWGWVLAAVVALLLLFLSWWFYYRLPDVVDEPGRHSRRGPVGSA